MQDAPGATHVENVSNFWTYMLSIKFLRYAKGAILSLYATCATKNYRSVAFQIARYITEKI